MSANGGASGDLRGKSGGLSVGAELDKAHGDGRWTLDREYRGGVLQIPPFRDEGAGGCGTPQCLVWLSVSKKQMGGPTAISFDDVRRGELRSR